MSGNAAGNYEQIDSVFMLPWAEDLAASANLTAGERAPDLACRTGFIAARPSVLRVPKAW